MKKEELDEALRLVREYEKERFKFTVENDRWQRGYIMLSVTHNGFQWNTMSFSDADEVRRVAEALLEFIKENPKASKK